MKAKLSRVPLPARKTSVLTIILLQSLTLGSVRAQEMTVGNLLVEHRIAPVGVDAPKPRFSWKLKGAANGLRQTAYQIQVTSGAADQSVVWDSGWVDSDQSHLVVYAGQPLRSSTPYFWRVRIKNEAGLESEWSESTRWVTGLLDAKKELTADWIGYDQPCWETPSGDEWFDIGKAKWICHPALKKGEDSVAFYRTKFEVPAETTRVMIGMELNFTGQFFLNGIELFQGGRLGNLPRYLDVTPWIKSGMNQLAFRVNECKHKSHPGLIAAVRMEQADGKITRHFTDATWQTTLNTANLWAGGKQSDDGWVPVNVLGKPGDPNTTGQGDDTLLALKFDGSVFMPPAVCLRKEIELKKPVRFAVFHGTAQGLYDLHVNGRRLTETGFQPGWTQYEIHTSYVSTDVTAALQKGKNAIGAVLADGWFRGNVLWFGREKFGDKIRFSGQLEVEYKDGSRESFRTDPTWKAAYGPIRQADILNGEVYDARLEQKGWDQPGFDDRSWQPVTAEQRSGVVNPSKIVDVTDVVRGLVDAGKPVAAKNSLAGDPCVGVRKSLVVSYRCNEGIREVKVNGPKTWDVPGGLRGVDITSAVYGDNK